MTNKLALSVKAGAERHLSEGTRFCRDNKTALESRLNDYADLIWIALLIETGWEDETIRRAIRKLDTVVRDVIPEKIFDRYFPEKS